MPDFGKKTARVRITFMKQSMLKVLIIVSTVCFIGGYMMAVLPCRYCQAVVLKLGTHEILGEHRLYCPQRDN